MHWHSKSAVAYMAVRVDLKGPGMDDFVADLGLTRAQLGMARDMCWSPGSNAS